jgi:hypothetical protein
MMHSWIGHNIPVPQFIQQIMGYQIMTYKFLHYMCRTQIPFQNSIQRARTRLINDQTTEKIHLF